MAEPSVARLRAPAHLTLNETGRGPDRPATPGPLPRAYSTPECRTGGDRWPDLHQMCSAPGYQDRVLGWVKVPCACACHPQAPTEGRAS